MKRKRFYLLTLVFSVSCLTLTALMWRSPLLLILFLAVNGAVLVAIGADRKRDAILFALSAVFGAAAESFVISLGGAWSYVQPGLFGIPVWLPLVWGTAGVFLVRLSDAISGLLGS